MNEPERQLEPATRYTWEAIVRRARLGSLIAPSSRRGADGRSTRGGVSGTTVTAVALAFASYADPDGSRVWPGDAVVAVDLETSIDVVKRVRQALVRLGLLLKVAPRRRSRGEEYRLTLPADLLEVVDVLTPAQHQLASERLREAKRGKSHTPRGGSGGSPEPSAVGGPADPPNRPPSEAPGGPADPPGIAVGGPADPRLGDPAEPLTYPGPATTTTSHTDRDRRTAVPGPRAPEAAEDPISQPTDQPDDRPPPLADVIPIGERCPHGISTRPPRLGRPALGCPACARGLPPAPGTYDPHDGATRAAEGASVAAAVEARLAAEEAAVERRVAEIHQEHASRQAKHAEWDAETKRLADERRARRAARRLRNVPGGS